MANEKDLKKLGTVDMEKVDGGLKYVLESRDIIGEDGVMKPRIVIFFYKDDANTDYATNGPTDLGDPALLMLDFKDQNGKVVRNVEDLTPKMITETVLRGNSMLSQLGIN